MNSHPNAKTTLALRKAIRECPLTAGKVAEKFNVNINQSINGDEEKKMTC